MQDRTSVREGKNRRLTQSTQRAQGGTKGRRGERATRREGEGANRRDGETERRRNGVSGKRSPGERTDTDSPVHCFIRRRFRRERLRSFAAQRRRAEGSTCRLVFPAEDLSTPGRNCGDVSRSPGPPLGRLAPAPTLRAGTRCRLALHPAYPAGYPGSATTERWPDPLHGESATGARRTGSPGTHPEDGCGAASRVGPGDREVKRSMDTSWNLGR